MVNTGDYSGCQSVCSHLVADLMITRRPGGEEGRDIQFDVMYRLSEDVSVSDILFSPSRGSSSQFLFTCHNNNWTFAPKGRSIFGHEETQIDYYIGSIDKPPSA